MFVGNTAPSSIGVDRMPRRKLRKTCWKLYISEEIAATIEEKVWDPVLNRPRYGGRSELIEFLLRYFIDHPEIMPPEVAPEVMEQHSGRPESTGTEPGGDGPLDDPELASALRLAGLRK